MTQKKSYNSVKVKYLDGNKIIAQLRNAAALLKRNDNVMNVYLFGSLVRGDYVPGSDADVCIILKKDKRRIIDRIPQFLDYFAHVSVPVDIFPYTQQEIDRMKSKKNPMLEELLSTGIEL